MSRSSNQKRRLLAAAAGIEQGKRGLFLFKFLPTALIKPLLGFSDDDIRAISDHPGNVTEKDLAKVLRHYACTGKVDWSAR